MSSPDSIDAPAPLTPASSLPPSPQITMADCALLICERYNVTLKQIRSPFQGQALIKPRHLCAALCRSLTGASWQNIRLFMARADNHAIVYACRRANALYPDELAELSKELEKRAGRAVRNKPIIDAADDGLNERAAL